MSDDPQQPGPPGPPQPQGERNGTPDGGGEGKKRRRRRRGGKRKRGGTNPPDPAAQANAADGGAGAPAPHDANASDAKPNPTDRDASSPRSDDRPRKPGPRDQHRDDAARRNDRKRGKPDGKSPAPTGNDGKQPGAKARKKRKPRTKQCVQCYTPCTVVHKVRLDHRKQWVFICDICWPSRCVDNPHYEYQATWVSGRINRPGQNNEQQQRGKKHDTKQQRSAPPQYAREGTQTPNSDPQDKSAAPDHPQPGPGLIENHNDSGSDGEITPTVPDTPDLGVQQNTSKASPGPGPADSTPEPGL